MNNLLFHSLETAACIAGFTLFYFIFLRKEHIFGINRLFLLFSMVFAILIPLFNIPLTPPGDLSSATTGVWDASFQQVSSIKESIIHLNPVIINNNAHHPAFSILQIAAWVYLGGAAIHFMLFAWRLIRLLSRIYKSEKIREGQNCFVIVPESENQVYSFFHFIFISRKHLNQDSFKPVIDHEKAHSAAFHSIDLMITEFVVALNWFNPFAYLLRKAMVENHEFQVDRKVVRSRHNKINYLQSIVNQWINHHCFTLTSAFSHSLSKKRILMLTKRKSGSLFSKAKVLAVIPLSLMFFFLFACSERPVNKTMQKADGQAIAFHQVTQAKVGKEIPKSLYQKYHQQLDQKGEQILLEMYSEFEGKEYASAIVRMDQYSVYGIHLYNYGSDRTTSYLEITDTSGNIVSSMPNPHWAGWLKEKSFYLDLMTAGGPYQLTIKDSKNRLNRVVLVMTRATSLDTISRGKSDVYLKPDQMPVYNGNGSLADFREDVMKNIEYPGQAKDENIEGMVYVTFVVNQAGNIEEKQIMKGAHHLLDQAALDGLDGLPGWHPGMVEGKPVKTQFTIPILFRL